MIPVVFRSLCAPCFSLGLAAIVFTHAGPVLAESLTPRRQAELINILKQDCGSCHGLTLKGGLGPPLTRAALSDKPPEFLYNTILLGREHTAMPPWDGLLTKQEINWVVRQLKNGLDEYTETDHE